MYLSSSSYLYLQRDVFSVNLWHKEIKPVNSKGNQSWIFIGKTDAEAEPPILWPPDANNWDNGKAPDVGKDWRQEKKGMTEDEMVEWYHWLNRHEFEQALGVWWTGKPGVLHHGFAKSQTLLSNWNDWLILRLHYLGFPGGSVAKNLPAMQDTQIGSPGWENALQKGNGNPLQ